MCRNLCCSTECHKYEEGYALEKQKATTATVSCTQYGLNWSKMEWQTRRKQNAKVIIESRESSAYSYINIPHADKMHAGRRADEEEEVGAVHCSFFYVPHKVLYFMHIAKWERQNKILCTINECVVSMSVLAKEKLCSSAIFRLKIFINTKCIYNELVCLCLYAKLQHRARCLPRRE